jgi:hypothetical protein
MAVVVVVVVDGGVKGKGCALPSNEKATHMVAPTMRTYNCGLDKSFMRSNQASNCIPHVMVDAAAVSLVMVDVLLWMMQMLIFVNEMYFQNIKFQK